jgi:guanine deaminase
VNVLRLTAYLGHIISPVSSPDAPFEYLHIKDGALIVNDEGLLEAVGSRAVLQQSFPWLPDSLPGADDRTNGKWAAKLSGAHQIYDFGSRLILPGLIDMHLHLPQVSQTGKCGQHLLDWLNKYIFAAEAKFEDPAHAGKIARWFFHELAANGTTCAVIFTTIHQKACDIAFKEAEARGSRVIMGKVMMDANAPSYLIEDTNTALEQSEALIKKWHSVDKGRLLYALTPRFGVTATAQLLAGTGELLKKHPGVYLHTHLSEAKEEIQFMARLYPEARSYLDVYRSFGLVGARSIFAHAIHLDDADVSLLAQSASALAHCPSSNFFLKSGVFRYNKILKEGVLFGLGTDVAAGPSMSLFHVMKDANYMQADDWLDPRELLYRATLGGALACHLADKIGSLEVGKEADFIVVDPREKTGIVADILERPLDEILSSLVFLGDDRLIKSTYVRGRQIYGPELN